MTASNPDRSTPPTQDQIHPSEEGTAMIRRRGGSLVVAALEDDDMLEEILLRFPPQPSFLPRASAVCKRWRGLLTDPRFLRRFYEHHREPPLLGVFFNHDDMIQYTPILPAPDRVLPAHLDMVGRLLGCHHGLVLILHRPRSEVLVCDPITGSQHRVPIPPKLKRGYINGDVLCAARDKGHVHGGCHSTPFKVVLLIMRAKDNRPLASVYSSETNTWGGLISTEVPGPDLYGAYSSTHVGNVLYWSFMYVKEGILGFDFERKSLHVLEGPPDMDLSPNDQLIEAEDGTVAVIMLCHRYKNIHMWHRKVNHHGVATWVLWKTIETDNILGIPPRIEGEEAWLKIIVGHVEDNDGILLYMNNSVYMVQLKTLQSTKLFEARNRYTYYHSFKSFYAPGAREIS